MPGAEDETIAIEPARFLWVVAQRVAEKHRADLRAAERQAEVPGGTFVDGVHGETARFVGGARECIEIEVHRRKEAAERRRRPFEVKNAPNFDR